LGAVGPTGDAIMSAPVEVGTEPGLDGGHRAQDKLAWRIAVSLTRVVRMDSGRRYTATRFTECLVLDHQPLRFV